MSRCIDMPRTGRILLVTVALAVVASCSSSTDVPMSAEAATSTTAATHRAPRWVLAGIALARGNRSVDDATTGADDGAAATGDGTDGTDTADALPPREQLIPVLTGAGLNDNQANCVYNSITQSPQVSRDIAVLLRALTAAQGASGATSASSALAALGTVDPDTGKRLVVAISPCLDSATLFALLSAGGGGGGNIGLDSLASLAGTTGITVPTIPAIDAAKITSLVGQSLTAAQRAQIQRLLASASSLQAGNIPGVDLAKIDFSKFDLSKLTGEQASLLVAALLHGLSAAQQQQLVDIAKVDLTRLKLNVDPAKLKPAELGQLLLLISPLLAASISPNGFAPPSGVDPTQIYIPPGTDLSQLNPLLFLNRDDIVNAAKAQGGNPALAGCLYDKFRAISPATLTKFFSSSGDPIATGEVLLSAIACVANPGG